MHVAPKVHKGVQMAPTRTPCTGTPLTCPALNTNRFTKGRSTSINPSTPSSGPLPPSPEPNPQQKATHGFNLAGESPPNTAAAPLAKVREKLPTLPTTARSYSNSSVRNKFAFGKVAREAARLCTARERKDKARAEWVAAQEAHKKQRFLAPVREVQETFVATEVVSQPSLEEPEVLACPSASSAGPWVPGPFPPAPGGSPAWPPSGPRSTDQENNHSGEEHLGSKQKANSLTATRSVEKEQLFLTGGTPPLFQRAQQVQLSTCNPKAESAKGNSTVDATRSAKRKRRLQDNRPRVRSKFNPSAAYPAIFAKSPLLAKRFAHLVGPS